MSDLVGKILFQKPSTYIGELGFISDLKNSAAARTLSSTASSLSQRFSFLTNPKWLPAQLGTYLQKIGRYSLPAISFTASVIPLYQYAWQWKRYCFNQGTSSRIANNMARKEGSADFRGGEIPLKRLQTRVNTIAQEMELNSCRVIKGKELSHRVESIGNALLVRGSDLGIGCNENALELAVRMELFRSNYHVEPIKHTINLATTLGTVAFAGTVPGWIFIAAKVGQFVLERLSDEYFARASIKKMGLPALREAGQGLIDDNRERVAQMRKIYTHIEEARPEESSLPSVVLSVYSYAVGFFRFIKTELNEARSAPTNLGAIAKVIRTAISTFHFITRDQRGDYRLFSRVQNGHLLDLINERLPDDEKLEILT